MARPFDMTQARRIQAMDRAACIEALRRFDRFPLDFTDDYLAGLSVEQLRHILLAAHVTGAMPKGRGASHRRDGAGV